jgi:hypothetical protein
MLPTMMSSTSARSRSWPAWQSDKLESLDARLAARNMELGRAEIAVRHIAPNGSKIDCGGRR